MRVGGPHTKRDTVLAHDEAFMRQAIRLAHIARERGDAPVGSVVVCKGRIIGRGVESVRQKNDLTAHAELKAMQQACRALGSRDLSGCTLYTTVEPCWMCSFGIRAARIARVVTGRAVPHVGGISSRHPILTDSGIQNWPRPPVVTAGVLEAECRGLFSTKLEASGRQRRGNPREVPLRS